MSNNLNCLNDNVQYDNYVQNQNDFIQEPNTYNDINNNQLN